MNKIKLFFIVLLLQIVVIGCDSSSGGSGGSSTLPVDFANPDTFVGTYDIEVVAVYLRTSYGSGSYYYGSSSYYYGDSSYYYGSDPTFLTNDCGRAMNYGIAYESNCNSSSSVKDVIIKGQVTIHKDTSGKYVVTQKLQLKHSVFDNNNRFTDFQYDYTMFTPVSADSITNEGFNFGINSVSGCYCRDLSSGMYYSNSIPYFNITNKNNNLILRIRTYLNGYNVEYYSKLNKTSDTPITLDPNTLYFEVSGFNYSYY